MSAFADDSDEAAPNASPECSTNFTVGSWPTFGVLKVEVEPDELAAGPPDALELLELPQPATASGTIARGTAT